MRGWKWELVGGAIVGRYEEEGKGGGIVPLLTKIMYLACIRGSMTGALLEGKRKGIGWLKRESEEERRKGEKKHRVTQCRGGKRVPPRTCKVSHNRLK